MNLSQGLTQDAICFTKFRSEDDEALPVKINWGPIADRNGKAQSIIAIVTKHPAW